MFVVDRSNGELLEIFNPGQGVCAAPTVDAANHRLFVLSNSGSLYAPEPDLGAAARLGPAWWLGLAS